MSLVASFAGLRQPGCHASSAASGVARVTLSSLLSLGGLFTFGRTLLQGHSSDALDDHLLQDIGLTRADLHALNL